jgi:small-conductance mechanosensitive channel
MWEWFFSNAVLFIILSLILLAVLFLFSFRQQIKKGQQQASGARINLSKSKIFTLAVIATVVVGTIITALLLLGNIIARRGIDITVSSDGIRTWLVAHGIPIIAIVLTSYMGYRIIRSIIPHVIERSVKVRYAGDEGELVKRSQTLSKIVISTVGAIIFTVAVLMVLDETGRDITPLLAGAGIAGIAIGFGAQSLVKDVLNGLFIILEDQYRKGDVVKIADISGLVEDLSLRRTVLRDMDGNVHTIPNGQVVTASNYTKEWSRVNFDVPVPYYEDIDRVMLVINRIGAELAEDPDFKPMIISPPKALRVSDLNDKGVMIKVFGETKPLKQWDVAGEMRKRIKSTFDKENIAIPWAYGGFFSGRRVETGIRTCEGCGFSSPLSGSFCSNCGAPLRPAGSPGENKPPIKG